MPTNTSVVHVNELMDAINTGHFHVDGAMIDLVAVKKSDFTQDLNTINAVDLMEGVDAEVLGKTIYTLGKTRLIIRWKLENATYQFSQGLLPNTGQVTMTEIDVDSPNMFTQGDDQIIAPGDLSEMIREQFMSLHQDWKTHAVLYTLGFQPTHLSLPDQFGIHDMESVPGFTELELSEMVASQGLDLTVSRVLDARELDGEKFFRGFSAYQFKGLPMDVPVYIFLNWVIRVDLDEEENRIVPEIMLIETESAPRTLMAGAFIVDSTGKPIDSKSEALFLLKLLQNRRDWIEEAIRSFSLFFLKEGAGHRLQNLLEELSTESGEEDLNTSAQNQEPEFQTHVVKRDGEKDLQFVGNLKGSAYKTNDQEVVQMSIYQTQSGKWIAAIERDAVGSEDPSYAAVVCESDQCVTDFFGASEMAKRLYREAGIQFVEIID